MKASLATVALALTIPCVFQASAATFNEFIAFGDSTLDSGWWRAARDGQCGAVAAPCTTGNPIRDSKISDAMDHGGTGAPVGVGLMSTQVLAQHYNLQAEPANQPGGTNYAISGALSARVGGSPGSGNVNPNPNLPSTVEQIATYLAANSNSANPNAIYEIGSGGNDRAYATDPDNHLDTLADRQAFLSGQAMALATAIQSLQAAGAQTILVRGAQGSMDLAGFWTNELFSDLSALGVTYIAVDIAGLVATVQGDPTAYGFTDLTVMPGIAGDATRSACVAGVGAVGWGQFCGNTTIPQANFAHLRSTDSEQTSFYSDDQHFSAAGQAIVANYEIGLIEARLATPLPAALPMFASGLGVLGLLYWRRRPDKPAA